MIVNPGARRAESARADAVRAFAALSVPCETVISEAVGHTTFIAKDRGAEFDAVFTVGGDGTAMEAITALSRGGPPVGIIPGGTGNVLARTFRIPLDAGDAVRVLVAGHEQRIDLGQLGDGRCFAIGAGVGLDEAMMSGASYDLKQRIGVGAYVWSAMKALRRLERFHARVTVDGVVHEYETSSVLLANLGEVLGGVMNLGHDIRPDDGLLTACVFSPTNHVEALGVFAAMVRGTAHRHARATYLSGKHFLVETQPPRRAQADGELLDEGPLEASVVPLAARLLVPST